MAVITTNLFPILCLCFTVVLCECNTEERKPWVLPTRYIDYDKPYIEFTCSVNLQRGESLTWYKYNESDRNPLTTTAEKQAGHKKLNLLWPLALLSSGDNISCSFECPSSRAPNGVLIYSQTPTQNISIIFNRTIPPLDHKKIVMVTPEVFADDGTVTEFTCWANLHQGELLSWYQIKGSMEINLTRTQQENLYGYTKVKLVKTVEPSDNGTQLYCAKEQMSPNMTIAKSGKSQKIQIKFRKHIQSLETPYIAVEPRLDNIIGDENEELKFVCSGSKPVDGRNITWLIQGPDMKISYPNNVSYDDINVNHQLTLRMEQSYHKSQLYCDQDYKMKLQVPETDQIINEYHYGMLVRSQPTTLLHRSILKEAAFVTVEPNTSVHFDVNTTLRFTCRGSKPVGGRTYSWFRIDSNSSLSIPEHQKYDPSTTTNVLELSLNETFHQNQLYCAQGFTSFIQNTDGSMQIKHYGELVTSNKVTLIRRVKEGETNWTILAIALPLTLVAVVAAAALWAARRRRAPPADFDDYATLSGETAPQVTYATLDLPQCESFARAQVPVLYAEIAGVYRP